MLTSKKPDMKLLGSLSSPLKFSSLKYDMICVVWRQKFIVSCGPSDGPRQRLALSIREGSSPPLPRRRRT